MRVDDGEVWDHYRRLGLHEADVDASPMAQVQRWVEEARRAGVFEPEATALATVGAEAGPTARMVLLKAVDDRGFTFFTNLGSRKGLDLAENPACALVMHWKPMSRQICVTGRARRVTDAESDAYFATRPRRSQLGAWASRQSEVIAGRHVLEARFQELAAAHEGQPVPRPPFWAGYLVVPDTVELWQGRPDRLHDRLRYRRDDGWVLERLSP